MKTEAAGIALSESIYRRLLAAYPHRHRSEYGAAMAQLFRDQCRDAWNHSRHWGLCKLWCRTLPDWACTSVLERLAALKERKTMNDKLANLFSFRTTPANTFFKVFLLVFILVLGLSVVITFILPESYASTARILVESDAPAAAGQSPTYDPYFIQTTFEIIQSELVLGPAVEKLKLNEKWGKKYFNGQTLKTTETLEILKSRLDLEPLRNTKLIAITAFSDDKNEAAQIANAVAESYQQYRQRTREELQSKALAVLQEHYAEQEAQIQASQAEMEELQKKLGIPDSVDGLSASLADAEKSAKASNAELAQLRALSDEKKRNVLPTLVNDAALSDLLGKLQESEQKYATLTNDYAVSNYNVTRVSALRDVLNRQIDDRVAGIMAALESRAASKQQQADTIALLIEKAKPSPVTGPYWDAKRNLDQLTESHKMLFAKIEEQKSDMQLPKPELAQITDKAEPGRAPVRPNKMLNIAIGAVVGMLLASAVGALVVLLKRVCGQKPAATA